jgi:hypothetical protein
MTTIRLGRDLPAQRAAACAEIDAAAETARAAYATAGALQALTYRAKAAEAADIAAGGSSDHPIIEAEAAATGQTVAEVAAAVLAAEARWTAATARIEAVRVSTKQALRAASAPAAIAAIVGNCRFEG